MNIALPRRSLKGKVLASPLAVMGEQREQNDDRNRHTEQIKNDRTHR
jgi:hypothetical protein